MNLNNIYNIINKKNINYRLCNEMNNNNIINKRKNIRNRLYNKKEYVKKLYINITRYIIKFFLIIIIYSIKSN